MSFGLRVWDESGNIQLDVANRLTRLVGLHQVVPSTSRQNITVPGFRNDGTWAAIAYASATNIATSDDTVTYYSAPTGGFSFGDSAAVIAIVRL